jgi:hypothetical protein
MEAYNYISFDDAEDDKHACIFNMKLSILGGGGDVEEHQYDNSRYARDRNFKRCKKPDPNLHFLNDIPVYYSIPYFKIKAFHLNYAHIYKIIFKVKI